MPKHRLHVSYPEEMREAQEIGYAFLVAFVDATGHSRSHESQGTLPPFQHAVEHAATEMSFEPAKADGKPASGGMWLPVIFNPKSASPKLSDATPRLLAVAPAVLEDDSDVPGHPPMVSVTFAIAPDGAITKTSLPAGLDADTRAAVEKAVKQWQFAPARKAGQPIGSELALPVICITPAWLRGPGVPPRVVDRQPPEYPIAMRRYGLVGEVRVDFIVDKTGHVKNPYVLSSTNPAFDDPAIKAVRHWKFEPGTRRGKAVNTHMQVPIIFQLETNPFSLGASSRPGSEPFTINGGDLSKLPPQLQYDTPPKIRSVQIPVYPYEDRRDRVKGNATVSMLIDTDGRVSAVKIVSATKPEFGLALAAAVEGFRFDPALKNGKPCMCLLKFEQKFSDDNLPDEPADDLLRLERKHPEKIIGARKIDGALKPVSVRPGIFPTNVDETVTSGSAVIEGLIDEDGHLRLPRIVKASAPEFGYAAVQAASAWWFSAPTSSGKPAVARVEIPFEFKMKSSPAAAKTEAEAEH